MASWRRRADVSPLCASSRVRSVIINKRSIIINKFFGDEIQSEIFGVGCCRPLSSAATSITALYNAERGVLSRPRLRASELACAHARHGATGLLKCGLIVRGSRPYRQRARAAGAVGRTRTDLCSPRVDWAGTPLGAPLAQKKSNGRFLLGYPSRRHCASSNRPLPKS